MNSVGQHLQERRRQRGMSLDEAATRTRITRSTLEALENDDYTSLTVEVTAKGFLRAYARCLGMDEREVLTRYEGTVAERHRQEAPPSPIGETPHAIAPPAWKNQLTLAGVTLAALAVIIVGVIAMTSKKTLPEHPSAISVQPIPPVPPDAFPSGEQEPSGTASPPPVSPSAPQSAASTIALTQPPATVPEKSERLTIAAIETSWVHVTIDGDQQKEALLQPGERVAWDAAREFRLTLGNAGGVQVTFNGEPLPSLGPSGRVRTVTLPSASVSTRPSEPVALTSPPDSDTVPPLPLNN